MRAQEFLGWETRLPALRDEFRQAKPFPHVVLDDFLSDDAARALREAFSQITENWVHYHHYNESKRGMPKAAALPAHARGVVNELSSPVFLQWLSALTGLPSLLADPELDGGGLHETRPGGFLRIHTDYLSHTTRPSWRRRVNLLLFLNPEWQPEWKGALELWGQDARVCQREILPSWNRCVIFETSARSYHGHPKPLACPAHLQRRSLALYYFQQTEAPLTLAPTHYVAAPDEPWWKHSLVALDRSAVRAYSFLKRRAWLNDQGISAVLRRLRRH